MGTSNQTDDSEPTPKPSKASSPGFERAKLMMEEISTLANVYTATTKAQGERQEALTAKIDAMLTELRGQLDLLRATMDATEQLAAGLEAQTEKLLTATAALIKVANNLTAMMSQS